MCAKIKISASSGPLEVSFSGNSFFVSADEEVPLSKIAFDDRLIGVLGYDPLRVEPIVAGVIVDWEYYAGRKKERVQFITRANRKAAIRIRELEEKLRIHGGCSFHSHGARHAKWKNRAGQIFAIPRHSRDIGYGLLRAILRQAGISMSVSEFLAL
jgi:predicted RNA binding protein YcfA (HicA-like mRNA interferase family)